MSFEDSSYLWILCILLFLFWAFTAALQRKKAVAKQLGNARLVRMLTANYSDSRFRRKFWLLMSVIFLGSIAAANLRFRTKAKAENRQGIDIIVALDVSKSMLSSDIKPTRLDQAKQVISSLADRLGEDNKIGFVLFAGQAILQMPLTDDINAIQMYLANATPDMVPMQGTEIGQALTVANNAFKTKEKKYKAVILISDGEDLDNSVSAPLQTLKDNGVTVYTVGVGTPGGAPIKEPGTNEYKRDESGNVIISKLNTSLLKSMAAKTGGTFSLLDNKMSAAKDIASNIDKMEKKRIIAGDIPGSNNYTSLFPAFIALMLLLVIAEAFIPETKTQKS